MPATLLRTLLLLAAVPLFAGCAALLPKAHSETEAAWKTFDEARTAVERIEPYKTTKGELVALGIGTERDATVTLLSHVDIAMRFPIGGVLKEDEVDRGIRDCMKAGRACNAYLINVKRVDRNRIGNFWLDALRFRRETDVSGWTFNALIIFVNDLAVYAVYGGQPTLRETEVERNPLGPLQGWGDWVGSKALN